MASQQQQQQQLDDNPSAPNLILLGVLGQRADITYDILHERILNPILGELGRMPDRVTLPSESTSSAILYGWAEKMRLDPVAYESDWAKLGRRARAFRDARIISESTHLLVFLGKRSEFYEKQAVTVARKGKIVFTVSNNFELEELVIEKEQTPQKQHKQPKQSKQSKQPKQINASSKPSPQPSLPPQTCP